MAASEHTPHYSLSQFGPNDRPSWIDDYNSDMQTLDTAVSDAQSDAADAKLGASAAQSSIQQVSQQMGDMTTEITDIKNRLDASNTVFNYFTWKGEKEVFLSAWATFFDPVFIADPSQGGIGDNDIISLLTIDGCPQVNGRMIQINQEGTYVIWSTINIGLFSPARQNRSAALSLQYFNDGIESETMDVIHGSFVPPLMADGGGIVNIRQSLSLPPTVVSLNAGAVIQLAVNPSANDGETIEGTRAPHMESSTGIIKIR